MDNCIFCKIVKGESPCYKIYEDDFTFAFLDISKDVYGHTLVVPKKHVENVLDCDNETLNHVIDTVKKVSQHYVDNCGFKGVNILNASGAEAQQSVFHLHFHLIPRENKNDCDAFPKLPGTNVDFAVQLERLKVK